MHSMIIGLFGWMPMPLQLVCTGVVATFLFITILHIVRFILDLIPFI